jgi:hypothetical protein
VGEVQFENSGNSTAQAPLIHGLALLHNFEYDSAAEASRDAQAAETRHKSNLIRIQPRQRWSLTGHAYFLTQTSLYAER